MTTQRTTVSFRTSYHLKLISKQLSQLIDRVGTLTGPIEVSPFLRTQIFGIGSVGFRGSLS